MPTSKAPTGLSTSTAAFWRKITGTYELRGDELRVLEDACREMDLIERMEKELRKAGAKLVVAGSMGQPTANPLLTEVRQHRAVLARLLGSLKLPDEDDLAVPASRSTSARAAANARWGKRGA